MGFLDRLLGREPRTQQPPYAPQPPAPPVPGGLHPAPGDDERAVARYRYLLRTAPPEALEQVHAEAFARLTPEQRSQVLAELSRDLPAGERPPGADPQSLARSATRAELRRPGYLEHTFSRGRFGGGAAGMGMGGSIVGSMMGTIAGVVIGSALADALFDGYGDSPEAAEAGDAGGADASTSDTSTGDTSTGDTSASDTGSADAGGADYAGGDFGGGGFGDFGGGDFGGGDF
jgi:hypothetical protein